MNVTKHCKDDEESEDLRLPVLLKGLEAYRYKNTADCAFQILKNEGPQA